MGPSGPDRSVPFFRLYILLCKQNVLFISPMTIEIYLYFFANRNISLVHLVLDRRVINHDFSSTTMIFNEVENGHAKSLVA